MHLLARGGKSPERSGHRSQDALLVAAGTRSRSLARAQFHSRTSTKCPAIAAAAAIEHYLATGPRQPETMFEHLYARLPSAYAGQRKEIEDFNA